MRTLFFIIALLLYFCTLTKAQQYAASVQHYGTEDGLAHREVNAIFQDEQGFMWFGTKFGLNRFDGQKFTTYNKEKNRLDFNDIQSIAQDADGLLWLMGPHGESKITLFNPLSGTAISFEEKFKKHPPSYTLDREQRLLAGNDGTIFFSDYNRATLISYHPKAGLRQLAFRQFHTLMVERVTARNTIWAVADTHILVEFTTDGRILHQYSHPRPYLMLNFGQRNAGVEFYYTIHESLTSDWSLYSVDEAGKRQEWPMSKLRPISPANSPVFLPINQHGLYWDGTRLQDPYKGTILDITPQTMGESIRNRSFYLDRNGRIWLGTNFGIYQVKLSQNHFQHLFYEPSGKGDKLTAIRGILVKDNEVYACLEKLGLYKCNRSGGAVKGLYERDNFAFMYGLGQDQAGSLYIGANKQLFRYNHSLDTSLVKPQANDLNLWTFHAFGKNQLLAGARIGLWTINTQTRQLAPFTQYNQFTELAQAFVLHIGADRQGTIWICANKGLYTFDPAKGITARYWNGGKGAFYLPAESYQHFYQDPTGILWLATANAGLIRWDRQHNQYRQFRRTEGLANDNLYAVYADWRGHLWISSDYGIMQFDPARFTTRTYFVEDGITHNEFNRISHYQEPDGRLYFGGLNGITAFDPRDFEHEKPATSSPLRITSFLQFDRDADTIVDKTQEVLATNTITILPDDRSSILDFALLNYASKTVFAYQFKGIDKNWNYQLEPTLRLSNLPYGDHQLLIKAQAANGQWSANTLAIKLAVVRPFYLSTWFLALLVGLVIAGSWGWVRWRSWVYQQEQQRLQTQIKQATARIEQDKATIAQQAQILQQLDQTKSRFFANISHEFRTPLTVILGMANELKRYHPNENPQRLRQAASLIERNGTDLLRLINQILDLSKIEAGEMPLKLVQTDLVSFIRYVGESFHSVAIRKNIQLQIISEQTSCEADIDKDKLQDIISNLLSNALKFTPAGGRVILLLHIQEGWHSLSPQAYYEEIIPTNHLTEEWIQISVSDTGVGIDPTNLANIFNRFYQAEDSSIAQADGTGIGLSFVRELVLLLHGGLAVRSRPGNGTEFIVSLPLTRQKTPTEFIPNEASQPAVSDQDKWLETASVPADDRPVLLLAEDNDDVAAYIHTCVEADYQVIRAGNGQTGIDLALEKVPDLILSDVMMPQKDGFELCDTLKNNELTSHIPIVLLTARAAVSDRIAGLRRGADAYLVKPFEREELQVVLHNLLQTRRLLQRHYSQLALGAAQPGELVLAEEDELIEDRFLHKLRTAVEAQLDNAALSPETICQLMGMSRTALHLKMTALTGMSISRYIRALRLRKAQELLAASSLNISEVAYAVGFDDPKYFSRVFSEEFGIAPVKFRLSAQG